jgi:superfamily II DNA helicase RecQ
MNKVLDGIRLMEVSFRSCVADTVAASLTIQAVRGSFAAPAQPPERGRFVPHPSLIPMLRDYLGNGSATFKSSEKAEALEISMAGDRHLFLIGPTAMGKSLVYMLPGAKRATGSTCVILPLSALHLDFVRRCRESRI